MFKLGEILQSTPLCSRGFPGKQTSLGPLSSLPLVNFCSSNLRWLLDSCQCFPSICEDKILYLCSIDIEEYTGKLNKCEVACVLWSIVVSCISYTDLIVCSGFVRQEGTVFNTLCSFDGFMTPNSHHSLENFLYPVFCKRPLLPHQNG